jgi:hypothetical protein
VAVQGPHESTEIDSHGSGSKSALRRNGGGEWESNPPETLTNLTLVLKTRGTTRNQSPPKAQFFRETPNFQCTRAIAPRPGFREARKRTAKSDETQRGRRRLPDKMLPFPRGSWRQSPPSPSPTATLQSSCEARKEKGRVHPPERRLFRSAVDCGETECLPFHEPLHPPCGKEGCKVGIDLKDKHSGPLFRRAWSQTGG